MGYDIMCWGVDRFVIVWLICWFFLNEWGSFVYVENFVNVVYFGVMLNSNGWGGVKYFCYV